MNIRKFFFLRGIKDLILVMVYINKSKKKKLSHEEINLLKNNKIFKIVLFSRMIK